MPETHFSKSHSHGHHFLFKSKKIVDEHAALYITNSLKTFAVALVGIFLPIYIFINSAPYLIFHPDTVLNGLIWILSYFALRSFGVLVFSTLLTGVMFSKIQLKRSIVLALIVQIIEVFLWLFSENNMYLMLIAGLLAGLKVTLYWIPFHAFFVKKFKKGNYGKSTGKRYLLEKTVLGLAPFIGGLIISNFGFEVLFITSIVILIGCGIPVLLSVNEWEHHKHNPLEVLKNYVFTKKYSLMSLAFLGEGIDTLIYSVFWPILLFIGITSFVKIGSLTAITTLISAITAVLVGKHIDKHGTKAVHGIGTLINTLLYIPRVFVITPLGLYIIDILDRLNAPTFTLPNIAISYEKAKKSENGSDFIIYREYVIHFSIFIVSLLTGAILTHTTSWKWVFFIAAAGSALVYSMDFDKN